jgi:hypothetical protein
LRDAFAEQAIELHLVRGNERWGLTGPVPRRVDGDVKAGLLDLVASAVEAGWSLRRACAVLEVNHSRVLGWHARLHAGAGLVIVRRGRRRRRTR